MNAILLTNHSKKGLDMFTLACSLILTMTLFTNADTAQDLLGQYQTLRTSLINQRGLATGDLKVIQNLRDEMSNWTNNQDDFQVIAAELQLSIWLEDFKRSGSLFERLSTLQPENTAIALAWGEFMLSQDGAEPNVVYGELIDRFPNSPEVVLAWVRTLDAKNHLQMELTP